MEMTGLITKRERDEILLELVASAENTNVIGLFFEGDDEMVTTAVETIVDAGNDKLVYLKETDLHGYPVPANPVPLNRIRCVVHFKTLFDDPVYVRIRQRRRGDVAA